MKDKKQICVGRNARNVIGFRHEQEPIELPDLSSTPWHYVFIQSNSRLRVLPKQSYFMFCEFI